MIATHMALWGLKLAVVLIVINAKTTKKKIYTETSKELEQSSTTTDLSAISLIKCTSLCMTLGTDCCALSYFNQICRLDSSCQFTTNDNTNSVVVKPCAPGWTFGGTACYLFSDNTETWETAKSDCEANNAFLAEPQTLEEIMFLKQRAQNIGQSFWIGADDLEVEDHYVWSSSGRPLTLTDWANGEPNNWHGGEHCLLINKSKSYKWSDGTCGTGIRFICERYLQVGMEAI